MNIILRPWMNSDLGTLVSLADNYKIARYMTDQFPHPYTEVKGRAFIEFSGSHSPFHILAIEAGGKLAGSIGIHPQADIMRMNAELGYWLGETFWGKGIATIAVKRMVEYAFANFEINRIFARPFGTNIASQRVLQKAGFQKEATFVKTIIKNGEMLDELIYAIRRES